MWNQLATWGFDFFKFTFINSGFKSSMFLLCSSSCERNMQFQGCQMEASFEIMSGCFLFLTVIILMKVNQGALLQVWLVVVQSPLTSGISDSISRLGIALWIEFVVSFSWFEGFSGWSGFFSQKERGQGEFDHRKTTQKKKVKKHALPQHLPQPCI